MPRKRKQVSVYLPPSQARAIDDVIESEAVPNLSRAEFVREAVARRLNEIRPPVAQGQPAGDSSSPRAEESTPKLRQGAVDDRSQAPGTYTTQAGSERGIVG